MTTMAIASMWRQKVSQLWRVVSKSPALDLVRIDQIEKKAAGIAVIRQKPSVSPNKTMYIQLHSGMLSVPFPDHNETAESQATLQTEPQAKIRVTSSLTNQTRLRPCGINPTLLPAIKPNAATLRYGEKDEEIEDDEMKGDSNSRPPPREKILKLMNYRPQLLPHIKKFVFNKIYSLLMPYSLEEHFSTEEFLVGARQAVCHVSSMIAGGSFEALEGIVEEKAILEIQQHFEQLTPRQRSVIAVDPDDVFSHFIYEIKVKGRRVVITTILHGRAGMGGATSLEERATIQDDFEKNLYVCNYTFIRDFVKGKETPWIIYRLNHMHPKDVVKDVHLFER